MRITKTLFATLAAAALLALSPLSAKAQSGASCPIQTGSPIAITGSFTAAGADNCKFFVVTSNSTITLPATTTVGAGWSISVKAQGATAIVTPSTGTLDGAATAITYTTGLGGSVRSNGTNYFSSGLGVSH